MRKYVANVNIVYIHRGTMEVSITVIMRTAITMDIQPVMVMDVRTLRRMNERH